MRFEHFWASRRGAELALLAEAEDPVLQVPGLERKRRKRVRGWSWAWLGADWRTGAGDLPLPLEERRGRCKGGADRGRETERVVAISAGRAEYLDMTP